MEKNNMTFRKYPVGIQTFSEIINGKYVYIDKTDLVWQSADVRGVLVKDTTTNTFLWTGPDEMTINYVKAFKLKTDCVTDVIVRDTVDFNNFIYSVKHSITMGGQNTPLIIPNNKKFTMRAVDSITIDGTFELPLGAEMTLITQDCPKCSNDVTNYPPRNCDN